MMIKIKELTQKTQLEITKEELTEYLEIFQNLEKKLVNFQKIKKVQYLKPMNRINVGYLSLWELKKLEKNFLKEKINKKTLKKNSKVDEKGFIFFKKNF